MCEVSGKNDSKSKIGRFGVAIAGNRESKDV